MGRAAPGSGRSRASRSVAPRRGAVGGGLGRGARAAAEAGSVSQPVEALRRRDRRERAAGRVVVEGERVEDRLDPRVVAVRVVVGRALAEVAQPADELGRVGAQELEHRLGLCERLAARAEGRRGGVLERGQLARRVASGRCWRRRGARAGAGRGSSAATPATSGRSSRRNGARSFVAGLDASTSTSRSSSVARRFTNVVFARRSVVGSRPSAWPSATFSSPIARAVAFVLPTRPERSSRRSASAPTSREESTRKRVSAGSSSVSWPTSRREVESSGLKYFAASPASAPLPAYCVGEAVDDVAQAAAGPLVERVEDLVEVDHRAWSTRSSASRRRRAPRASSGPGVSAT